MELLNKKIKTLFWVALMLSVGFPAGILGIIFGASEGIVALLVAGILLCVAGFYVMPILWLKYAERRQERTLLLMIECDHIRTVAELAAQSGHSEADVRAKIKRMINSRVLVGYIFCEDVLESNNNKLKEELSLQTRKCECCGAPMIFDGKKFLCEYCRHTQTIEQNKI